MHQYSPFLSIVDNILIKTLQIYPANKDEILQVLDGLPAKELRRLVPLDELRRSGAFFTGSRLVNNLISSKFASTIKSTSILVDPACGGGDLLLSCTSFLQISSDLSETLNYWRSNLLGVDLHSEFVEITKLRLVLKAITLGAIPHTTLRNSFLDLFDNIRVGSMFQNFDVLKKATHILLNPPYFMMQTPESCDWASGKVNAASIFLETCVKQVTDGTRIAAILPDVLRSGTRYKKWRDLIESKCEIQRIHLYGQFDAWADVDVFELEVIVKNEPSVHPCGWVKLNKESRFTVADMFDISIGPVVEYRDPLTGPIVKYIRPRGLPAWTSVCTVDNCRSFNGRTFQGPFVVVRRTSRQGDKHRAIGTIVNIKEDVAIENHLIILKPKDGKHSTCQELLDVLQNAKTNNWFNETIRCRHLTIKSVAELPWWRN
jgi:hypothetical protein